MKMQVRGLRHSRVLAILLLGIGSFAATGPAAGAESWGADQVRFVYPMANGSFVVTLNTDPPNCTAPSSPKYLWVAVGQNGVTAEGLKAMLATALAALAAGKQLQVAFDDSTTYCYVNRMLIIN
jgi:hypothetical protein